MSGLIKHEADSNVFCRFSTSGTGFPYRFFWRFVSGSFHFSQVLASGKLRTDAEEERRASTGENGRTVFRSDWRRNEKERKMSAELEKVAKEIGTEQNSAVAIANLMQKTPYVFPIIGGRKVGHLIANIEALKISFSEEQMKYLESILPFEPGYPHNLIGNGTGRPAVLASSGHEDIWPIKQPIKPSKL